MERCHIINIYNKYITDITNANMKQTCDKTLKNVGDWLPLDPEANVSSSGPNQ